MNEFSPTSNPELSFPFPVDIEHPLGRGQLSIVYPGTFTVDGESKPVAVKVFSPQAGNHQDLKAMFELECLLAPKVKHPNIVTYYDASSPGVSTPYVVRDIYQHTLDQHSWGETKTQQIVATVSQVAAALEYLRNEHQVFLSELPPWNVALLPNGNFGLGDLNAVVPKGENLPMPPYVGYSGADTAPELRTIEARAAIELTSSQSETYSLAFLTYTLFGGKQPDDFLLAMMPEWTPAAKDLEVLPDSLRSIVGQSLHVDPSQRFSTPLDFTQELVKAANL